MERMGGAIPQPRDCEGSGERARAGSEFQLSVALATVFAASFDIRHSSFVIHGTFCSFPEHHQWNTCERTLLALTFNCLMSQFHLNAIVG